MKITTIGFSALLGSLVSLSAIERPGEGKKKENVPVRPVEPQGGILDNDPAPEDAKEAKPDMLVAKVAYLGVGGQACSEALLAHLELESGLLLATVDPNSPAGLSGLKELDVIVSVNDKKLIDQDSLRKALAAHQPGDEVTLKLIRRGKPIEQVITLGEAPAIRNIQPQALMPNPAAEMNRLLNEQLGNALDGLGNDDLQKELMQQLEKAFGDKGQGFRQLRLDLGGNPFDANPKMGIRGIGSMRLVDDEGSIEMKMTDGQREVIIRDKSGKLLFEGPYDTDIDKAAVPEEYRERVERLDGGNGNSFQLKLNGRDLFDEKKEEPQKPKKKAE